MAAVAVLLLGQSAGGVASLARRLQKKAAMPDSLDCQEDAIEQRRDRGEDDGLERRQRGIGRRFGEDRQDQGDITANGTMTAR